MIPDKGALDHMCSLVSWVDVWVGVMGVGSVH